jgi:outer membrane immunogenic protein
MAGRSDAIDPKRTLDGAVPEILIASHGGTPTSRGSFSGGCGTLGTSRQLRVSLDCPIIATDTLIPWGLQMKTNKVWLTAAALGALFPATSFAADLPVKARPIPVASFDWSGFYIGVHAGYGGGMKDWDSQTVVGMDYVARGPLAGGQIGINKQLGSFVFGVELDGSWADIKGSLAPVAGGAVLGAVTTTTETSRIDGLLTLAGRAGLAADRWFVFAKGGISAAHEQHSYTQVTNFIPAGPAGGFLFTSAGEEVRVGPMLGFGTEYALTGNWTIKGEYDLHYFGARTVGLRGSSTFAGATTPFNIDPRIDQSIHVVKLGVNYRLGGVSAEYAPVPAAPGTSWSGGYAGVEGGYGWGHKDWPVSAIAIGATTSPSYDMRGWIGGGVIGANAQAGSFVFGVEGEFLGTGIKGGQVDSNVVGANTFGQTLDSKINWLALATARAGFVVGDSLLLYGKGGVAIADETHTISQNQIEPGGSLVGNLAAKAVHTGAVLGAGGEYAVAPNWSVKLEYDYVRMFSQQIFASGTRIYNFPGVLVGTAGFQSGYSKLGQDLQLVKFGVNYHFNPVPVVVAKY